MPELDVDLVRILALAMLGVIILILLLVLSSLNRIRKDLSQALDTRGGAGRPETSRVPAAAAVQDSEAAPAATAAEAAPAQARAPQAEPAAASAAAPGLGVAAAQPEEQVVVAAAPEPAPAATEEPLTEPEPEPEPQPVAEEPVAEQPAAAEPQEQPFERDGRWWFRRGDELLVYDEATGQWVASPQEAAPAAAPQPAGAMATTISGISGASQVSQTREPAAAEPEAAGFWKCPSCGAVNGSTATSCRMCFAARP